MNQANVEKTFGNTVKYWRKKMGLTQSELAVRTGLQRTKICDIELGNCNTSLRSVLQIAEALKVPVGSLLAPFTIDKREEATPQTKPAWSL
jgi:transcriptional regulator with XRE-family HTH domain